MHIACENEPPEWSAVNVLPVTNKMASTPMASKRTRAEDTNAKIYKFFRKISGELLVLEVDSSVFIQCFAQRI